MLGMSIAENLIAASFDKISSAGSSTRYNGGRARRDRQAIKVSDPQPGLSCRVAASQRSSSPSG